MTAYEDRAFRECEHGHHPFEAHASYEPSPFLSAPIPVHPVHERDKYVYWFYPGLRFRRIECGTWPIWIVEQACWPEASTQRVQTVAFRNEATDELLMSDLCPAFYFDLTRFPEKAFA